MKWHSQMPPGTRPDFLVVAGPTASGKSAVAMELAKVFSGSIICCDSVQVYRGFDVGSAKPSRDDQSAIPHHLFDEFSWNEPCDAAIYAIRARAVIESVRDSGRMPIVVGGTGLYLRALLGDAWDEDIPSDQQLRQALAERSSEDLYSELQSRDPRRAAQLHPNDRFRVIRALEINLLTGNPVKHAAPPQVSCLRRHFLVFMNPLRDALYAQINARTRLMLEQGLIDEVKSLLSIGVLPDCKPMSSIGYKEVIRMLGCHLPCNELESEIATATRQYAKRQLTWFKKVPSDVELQGVGDVQDLIRKMKEVDLIRDFPCIPV